VSNAVRVPVRLGGADRQAAGRVMRFADHICPDRRMPTCLCEVVVKWTSKQGPANIGDVFVHHETVREVNRLRKRRILSRRLSLWVETVRESGRANPCASESHWSLNSTGILHFMHGMCVIPSFLLSCPRYNRTFVAVCCCTSEDVFSCQRTTDDV